MNVRRIVRLLGLLLLLLGIGFATSGAAGAGSDAVGSTTSIDAGAGRQGRSDDRVVAPVPSLRVGSATAAVGRRADDAPLRLLADTAVMWPSEARDLVAWLGGEVGIHPHATCHPPRPGRAPPAA